MNEDEFLALAFFLALWSCGAMLIALLAMFRYRSLAHSQRGIALSVQVQLAAISDKADGIAYLLAVKLMELQAMTEQMSEEQKEKVASIDSVAGDLARAAVSEEATVETLKAACLKAQADLQSITGSGLAGETPPTETKSTSPPADTSGTSDTQSTPPA